MACLLLFFLLHCSTSTANDRWPWPPPRPPLLPTPHLYWTTILSKPRISYPAPSHTMTVELESASSAPPDDPAPVEDSAGSSEVADVDAFSEPPNTNTSRPVKKMWVWLWVVYSRQRVHYFWKMLNVLLYVYLSRSVDMPYLSDGSMSNDNKSNNNHNKDDGSANLLLLLPILLDQIAVNHIQLPKISVPIFAVVHVE